MTLSGRTRRETLPLSERLPMADSVDTKGSGLRTVDSLYDHETIP